VSGIALRQIEPRSNGEGPSRPLDVGGGTPPGTVRTLSRRERTVAWTLGLMLLGLGLLGFVNSFHEVEQAVEPSFGSLAWSAPIGIDLGIGVFTGLDLFLAYLGMRMRLLRLLPWSLVGITVALNVAQPLGRGDMIGAGTHGVLPVLWITAVEVSTHVMRHRAGLGQSLQARRHAGQMDRVRASRWLLAPVSTLRIRRLMILWEERSYQAALERWMARSRARGHMAKRHGRIKWRWRAPIDQRLDYRYAQLTLATTEASADRAVVGPGDVPPPLPGRGSRDPGGSGRRQGPAPKRRPVEEPGDGRRRVDDADLEDVVRGIDAAYRERGKALTARLLEDEVRARGVAAGNGRLTRVLAAVRDGSRGRP
jgi:Protein of unknown function (DUF2637)